MPFVKCLNSKCRLSYVKGTGHRFHRGDVMGYKIVYGPEISCPVRIIGNGLRFRSIVASAFLAFVLLVRSFWPEGCDKLRQVILPDAASEVQIAAEMMLKDLTSGKSVSESLTAFCVEVMHLDEAA